MARLIPSKPAGAIIPEAAKVLHALRRGPETLDVWMSLPLTDEWRPDFMTLHGRDSCCLVSVGSLNDAQAEALLHGDLFSPASAAPAVSEFERGAREKLRAFRESALRRADAEYGGARLPIILAIACPNAGQALLDQIADRGGITDCELWGRETIRAEPLAQRIAEAAPDRQKLPESVIEALREKFSPEMAIPEELTARVNETPDRNVDARLTSYFLDLDQEYLAKEDLTFSPEADAATTEPRLNLVTGVAGSGKSLILLYRAMLQSRLHPEAKSLILTHNRPLSGELQDRFRRLCAKSGAQWRTFYQWCHDFAGFHWEIIKANDREALLKELAAGDPALSRLPVSFLSEEIDWIRDQGLVSRDDYLAGPRLGRRRALQEEQRCAVLGLLERYREELNRRGLDDWPGVAAQVWRRVRTGVLTPPIYDFIYVDEAQFFAPAWLRLIQRCVRPTSGQLFLAADPTQGFLKRRQSWAASGLNVRGHTRRLLRSYRNSREILRFASTFYRRRLPDDEEEVNLPESNQIERQEPGAEPVLLAVDSRQSERARVAHEIAAALRAGAQPGHFLVLQSESALVEPFLQTLDQIAGPGLGRRPGHQANWSSGIRVVSLNAATGLESPIVFLCGIDALLEKEDALGLAPDEKSELVRDNTRRIYMGMTRAGQKLLITYRRPATRDLLIG